MDHDYLQPSRGKRRMTALFVLLAVIFLAAAVYCVFFGLNQLTLEAALIGSETETVEYGQAFQDLGCRTVLRGTTFWKDGWEIQASPSVSGHVNQQKLGKYVLNYRVSFLGMTAEATRTVCIVDTVPPVITLTPDPADLQPEPEYQEAGFSAFDNYDGDLTRQVERTQETGRILYTVTDSSGNQTVAQREIPVFDDYPPTLELTGGSQVTIPLGEAFHDPGYTATDLRDGDLTNAVEVSIDHPFVRYQPDVYLLTYRVSDSDGNETVAQRTLTTVPCQRPAVIYPKGKTIYLTFDDGPGPDTGRLLDVLKRYDVHATFFVVNTGYEDLMRRMVNEGHSIGIHTCTHRYQQIYSSPEAYFQDLFDMQQIIQDATGVQTWLLRFPGGSSNTISRKNKGIMTYLTKAVEACGFSYFDWNVDSNDAGGANTSAQVFENVVEGVGQNTYCVVLQHDIHPYSVDAVERIIQWGQRNGYQFLPLQTDSPAIHHGVQN
mgnify:FL=1